MYEIDIIFATNYIICNFRTQYLLILFAFQYLNASVVSALFEHNDGSIEVEVWNEWMNKMKWMRRHNIMCLARMC